MPTTAGVGCCELGPGKSMTQRQTAHAFAMRILSGSVLLIWLSACGSAPQQLGRSDEYCCAAVRTDFSNYRLDVQEMPGFLKPYVQDSLRAAMNETGLGESPAAVLVARVSFDQIEGDAPDHTDDFEGHLEAGGVGTFTARLTLRLIDTRSNTEVMRGALSRIHHVTAGDHMHEGRARQSMYLGFKDLLRKFAEPQIPSQSS